MILTRLVFLASSEQSTSFLVVSGEGLVVSRGILGAQKPATLFKGRTVLVVPGAEVVTRWLDIDSDLSGHVTEQAFGLLKDELGEPRESIHLALGKQEDDGTTLVSVISRALMQEFLDRAVELGIQPDSVIPDHLLLPEPEDSGVLAVALTGSVAVRAQRIAFSADDDLASVLIGDRRCTWIESAAEAERVFAEGARSIATNLLQNDFTRRQGRRGLRRIVVLATVAALSPLALCVADFARNEAVTRELNGRVQSTVRSLLGNVVPARAISEVRSQVAALRANDGFMRTAATLFEAMSRVDGVELESLSYTERGIIRATVLHDAITAADALKNALEQSGLSIDQDAPEERNSRMFTIITLRSN